MRNPYGPDRKQCRTCLEIKPIGDFRLRTAVCKRCAGIRQARWNAEHAEAVRAMYEKYRRKNASKRRADYAADPLKQTHNIWRVMIQRCDDSNAQNYGRYGGRGITVCKRWRESFDNFLADMGLRPEGLQIDRFPDINGNYEPGNCRWATLIEQRANRREPSKERKSAASRQAYETFRQRAGLPPKCECGLCERCRNREYYYRKGRVHNG